MKHTTSWANFAKGAAVAGLLGVSMIASANAASIVTITADPAGAGLSNGGPFSFNGIRTSDFSSINLTSTGGGGGYSFTETGFLPIAAFDPGNIQPPGLNGSAGASPYGLYISFTANGSLSPAGGGILTGSFSNINFTFNGDPGNTNTYNNFDATHQVSCSGCGDDILLASGTLFPGGTNQAIIGASTGNHPLPAAFVDLLFNATNGSFFTSPTAPFSVDLISQFSNTPFVTNRYTTSLPAGVDEVVTIGTAAGQGGAGSGQFVSTPVPEPASMAILGAGLLGLGLIRRRRRG